MTNETDRTKRSVSSLGELSRDVAPPRDLWPSISAQITSQAGGRDSMLPTGSGRSRVRRSGMQWVALAAVVSALAIGVWLGRSVIPAAGVQAPVAVAANGVQPNGATSGIASSAGDSSGSDVPGNLVANDTATNAVPASGVAANGTLADAAQANANQQIFAASLVTDPRYTMQRATMIRDLEAQLKTLPLDTQQKVAASLTTIRASMKDIQAALGRDPANALLQELLVNSYQDEMRVLTAVHEASGAGRGI